VFEEDGKIQEYVGGYRDWLRQGHQLTERDNPLAAAARRQRAAERRRNKKATKLTYKDQRELDSLPAEIETLEGTIASLQEIISAQDFYAREQDSVQATLQELADAEAQLETSVERWGGLESLKESYELQD
jgi:ATP-binding cassette subfamily F protein uup